jgi:hypothetical protein
MPVRDGGRKQNVMISQYLKKNKQYHAAINIAYANLVLNHSLKKILDTSQRILGMSREDVSAFFDKKRLKKLIVERFADVTFACYFDQNDICKKTSLAVASAGDLIPYIDCCNEAYSYHYLRREWIGNDRRIYIHDGQEDHRLFIVAT